MHVMKILKHLLFTQCKNKYLHVIFRYIKMSSPRINYMIALGCMLIYTAVIIWGVDKAGFTTQRVLCSVRDDLL